MTREEIQEERMRLGAAIAFLELKCPHEVYEIDKEITNYIVSQLANHKW